MSSRTPGPDYATDCSRSPEDNPKVRLIQTQSCGFALVAVERIEAGERIARFDGERYTWQTTADLSNDPPLWLRDHCIQIGENLSCDSLGLARFANHSCDPNCGIKDGVWITAMRTIEPQEEITWDYAMTEDNDWSMECRCGSPLCRGRILGYRFLPEARRLAYSGFISSWLLTKPRPYLGHTLISGLLPVGL